MSKKKWYKSRTVISGILKTVAGMITALSQLLAGELDTQTFLTGLVIAIWGVHDVIIRFKTNTPITK